MELQAVADILSYQSHKFQLQVIDFDTGLLQDYILDCHFLQ